MNDDPKTDPMRNDMSAAWPCLLLGASYGLSALGIPLPLVDRSWLGTLMGIEVLAIHSFPFIMIIASKEPTSAAGKKLQTAAFWGLLGAYVLLAAKLGGLAGVISFGFLTFATYVGYLRRRTSSAALAQLIARWVASFVLFILSSALTGVSGDMDAWPGHRRLPFFGMLYFTGLGYLEWSGFYQRPRVLDVLEKLSALWSRKMP